MAVDIGKIKAAVTAANAGIESVLALLSAQAAQIRGLAQQLTEANAQADPQAQAAVQIELDNMADGLIEEAQKIAAATQAPAA